MQDFIIGFSVCGHSAQTHSDRGQCTTFMPLHTGEHVCAGLRLQTNLPIHLFSHVSLAHHGVHADEASGEGRAFRLGILGATNMSCGNLTAPASEVQRQKSPEAQL